MHSRCNGPTLLGAIVICVAMAIMEPDIIVKKPYGPKMCARLYNRTAGCSSYNYRTSDLSCWLTLVTCPKQNPEKIIYPINATKDKERMDAENDVRCSQGEKICPRRYTTQSTSIASKHPTLPSEGHERREKMRRILFWGPKHPSLQLYLHNKKVVTYPFLRVKELLAVAYTSFHRQLVVSIKSPKSFYFTPIDKQGKNFFIKTNLSVTAIAIDDIKQCVFMLTQLHKRRCLCDMSTRGKTIEELFCSKTDHKFIRGKEIVDDHMRSRIYIINGPRLLQFTYQGVRKEAIFASKLYGNSLHIQGDDLYYLQKKGSKYVLVKLLLSDPSVKQVATCMCHLSGRNIIITSVDNIIYMIPYQFKGVMCVLNKNHMDCVRTIGAKTKHTTKKDKICLLP